MARKGLLALAGTAVGVGAGLVAQRSMVTRRRRNDPEVGERFGERRGERSRYLDLPDGARIFVEESGPARSRSGAVFLHGSALRTDLWHYQLSGIGGHRCVFFDLRGHGLSEPKGDRQFSIGALADDLRSVIEDSGLKEVVLVGHSIGGMVALELCAAHPDLVDSVVKGLVLANTTSSPATETTVGGAALARAERFLRNPLDVLSTHHQRVDRLRQVIRPTDQIFLAVSFAAFGPNASARQIDFASDMLAETSGHVLFDLVRSYGDYDVREHLGDINIPALVIAGSHDRITVLNASEELAELLPKAELTVLQRCGHMSMLERHQDFNTMLERFLDDTLGRPT
jgi:pimeloyl-ACP methyl ester carboxylesterase